MAWMASLSAVFRFKDLREWSCTDWRGTGKIEAIRPERRAKGRRMGRGVGASRARETGTLSWHFASSFAGLEGWYAMWNGV